MQYYGVGIDNRPIVYTLADGDGFRFSVCRGVGEGRAGGAVAPPLLKAGGPDPLEGACYARPLLNWPPLFSTWSYPSGMPQNAPECAKLTSWGSMP